MEYVYAAMVLHEADRDVTEENVTEILEAADVEVEDARVRALVAALEDVDIDEAIETAAVPAAGAPAAPAEAEAEEAEEEAAEEEAEEEEEPEEEEEVSGEGLGDLFG
ncbi:50S ribosomal protein P1 [Natribaculum luteum]|uniref:Large ribosomal subunit protein P1 n=1 Tax=Natribaculum luteum TaxID=1586232 RepID=A0ABD5P136_9EURY|nr:50S ribosomal protein P1 [Natribaculum luteum]